MKVVVPQNAAPGLLSVRADGPTLCDAGPDSRVLPPDAWVSVTIVPYPGAPAPTPDSAGRMLHCLWRFARQDIGYGRRREAVEDYTPAVASGTAPTQTDPIFLETDPGRYPIATGTNLYFIGGTPGDQYDVSVTVFVPRNETDPDAAIDVYEPPFEFGLTSYVISQNAQGGPIYVALPTPPLYHQFFQVVQGSAQVATLAGRIPLDVSYGREGRVPLTTPIFVATGVFRTTGAI